MKQKLNIVRDISLLYELSLAIGNSLDIHENCDHFLSVLMRRMNITYTSVWLADNIFDEEQPCTAYHLHYGYPQFRVGIKHLSKIHPIVEKLRKEAFCQTLAGESLFDLLVHEHKIEEGVYVCYQLGNIGFLKLYVEHDQKISLTKLRQLQAVINKFAISLEACVAHKKSLLETSRKKAVQVELEASKEKYQSVVRNIAEGLVITDMNGHVVFVNDRMCEMTGLSREETLNRVGYKLVVPEVYWGEIKEKLGRRKFGLSDQYEFPIRHKAGHHLWVSINAAPYKDVNGNITGSLAAFIDITERKKAEQKILESQQKLQMILNTSLDAIITIDENGLVTDWNPNASKIFGFSQEEILGEKLSDFIIPSRYRAMHDQGMKKFLDTGEGRVLSKRIEMPALTKSGKEILIELSISPIKIEDRYFFSAFARDITQRKRGENALIKAKQDAEQARNAERQFLAHMSHEIRTPMNAVIGMTHLLMQSSPTTEQKEYLEALKFSGDSLMNIISDVLDLSKIEAGELELDLRPFSLPYLMMGLQKTYQFKVQEKNISVEIQIDDAIQNEIVGDQTRLNQILSNLMNNSSKFTEEGVIGVHVQLAHYIEGMYWVLFEVYDTGVGIAEEDLELIFRSFKQVNSERQKQLGGTGLGLSIVRQLVALCGGIISVESELGEGTKFQVLMPFEDSHIPAKSLSTYLHSSIEVREHFEQLNILVVEDNPINQKLMITILEQWGVSYRLASNGKQALAYARNEVFDLIFMDINMPIMNGYEATCILREDKTHPNQDVPIITLTAAALQDERQKMFRAGVNDFITKPFSPQQLRSTIIKWIDEKLLKGEPQHQIDKSDEQAPKEVTKVLGFDLSYLERFSQGNTNFMIEMLEMFLEQNPQNLQALNTAFRNQDWSTVREIAHQLKSTYGTLGMQEEQELAKQIDLNIKQGKYPMPDYAQWIDKINAQSQYIYPLLKSEVKRLVS